MPKPRDAFMIMLLFVVDAGLVIFLLSQLLKY